MCGCCRRAVVRISVMNRSPPNAAPEIEKWNGATSDRVLYARIPRPSEIVNAADGREHVDTVRRQTNLDDHTRRGQVAQRHTEGVTRSAELRERPQRPLGVVALVIDPHIEILRRARESSGASRTIGIHRRGVRVCDDPLVAE